LAQRPRISVLLMRPTFYTFGMSYTCPTLSVDNEAKDGPGGALTPRGLAGTCWEVRRGQAYRQGGIASPP
jgi:hypothetical protein